ncbi:uncharacterized protein BJ171DRAFT_484388 [Polychytrium aggregatum]|uniref:uncharacterized protein n=1 Tax=Polychytrium aggregatum TaxID=110093 RepID=UPI0022FE022F|nr:uncharacterized protein BJ171DRAFT_484388 [Polychytrium aggregatum]KAI9209558.1 hypothetical protein BJ171DRAFT_484388 [Polychytrium aggregatum]
MFKRKAAEQRAKLASAQTRSRNARPEHTPRAVSIELAALPKDTSSIFGVVSLKLLLVLALQALSIWLFASGFLLTRMELPTLSTCDPSVTVVAKPSNDSTAPAEAIRADGLCWHPPRYKRAVLVILDALRYDFTVYNESMALDESQNRGRVPFYRNKLPVLHRLLHSQPSNALLFRSKVDPPTTTLQRLKAITTGTLPTFVDIGKNFGGSLVSEDNIMDQLKTLGRKSVVIGDDTWEGIYPQSIHESYPYPSFDVWDLHTVDNGVLEHLWPILARSPRDWDFIVAHFLGIDHAGHRYGPEHRAMADKLVQINQVLEQLFEAIDDDTVVVVMGDHGMDFKGDHGGDSKSETDAGLFIFSKKKLTDFDGAAAAHQSLVAAIQRVSETQDSADDPIRTVSQIDVVSTLTLLLGLPIPFGNLGSIIPELFFVADGEHPDPSPTSPWLDLLKASHLNAKQIWRYLQSYSQALATADFSLPELGRRFSIATESFEAAARSLPTEPELLRAIELQYEFMRSALKITRRVWSRFDLPLIAMGCAGFFAVVLACAAEIRFSVNLGSLQTLRHPLVGLAIGALIGMAQPLSKALAVLSVDSEIKLVHEVGFALLVGYAAGTGVRIHQAKQGSKPTPNESGSVLPSPEAVLATLLLGLHAISPASDSYTIYEDYGTNFMLQTFGAFQLVRSIFVRHNKTRENLIWYSVMFMVLSRLTLSSVVCRPEQHPHCIPTFNSAPSSSVAAMPTLVFLALISALVVIVSRRVLTESDSFHSTGSLIVGVFLPAALSISFLYWTLDTIEGHHYFEANQRWLGKLKMWIAKIGFLAASATCLYVWTSEPSCIGLSIVRSASPAASADTPGKGGKNDQDSDEPAAPDTQATVVLNGIANVVGSAYFVLVAALFLILAMFQKPMGGVMLWTGFLVVVCLFEMAALWREYFSLHLPGIIKKESERTAVPAGGIRLNLPSHGTLVFLFLTVLSILSHRLFFATGHQFILSTIQWEVGFIGVEHMNFYLSGTLVALNTFGGPLACALSVPMFVIWKQPIQKGQERRLFQSVFRALLMYMVVVGTAMGVSMSFAGWFRRHLMVWSVFSPKFLYMTVIVVAIDLVVATVCVWGVFGPLRCYDEFVQVLSAKLGSVSAARRQEESE